MPEPVILILDRANPHPPVPDLDLWSAIAGEGADPDTCSFAQWTWVHGQWWLDVDCALYDGEPTRYLWAAVQTSSGWDLEQQ